jgi:hypothetical protein
MASDYVDSPRILQSMHEAGITSVAFVRPKMLNDCQEDNLKCIVFDERLSGDLWSKPFRGDLFHKNLATIVKEVGNHPALWGYDVKDEPPESDFPELAKAVAAVNKLAPGKWPYINLFPGEGEAYDKYLDYFVDLVRPAALSYDRYSIVGETGSGGLDSIFWENLSQVRDAAQRHHLPFWNIVLTSPHWRYRDLTEADFRLQVWASLAYGVRGISYYKFISKELPILNADDLGNWRRIASANSILLGLRRISSRRIKPSVAVLGCIFCAISVFALMPPKAHCADSDWIRPATSADPLIWGRRDGIIFGLPSQGGLPGPRGLIRVGMISPTTHQPQLLNFIAIEPVTPGAGTRSSRMAFSELELSTLDQGSRGKRLWVLSRPAARWRPVGKGLYRLFRRALIQSRDWQSALAWNDSPPMAPEYF